MGRGERRTNVTYSPEYRQARWLSGAISGRISDYEKNVSDYEKNVSAYEQSVAAYETQVSEYEQKRKSYETQFASYQSKYQKYIKTKAGKSYFAPTRPTAERGIKNIFKQYQAEGQQLNAFQQSLMQQQQSLQAEQQHLQAKQQQLETTRQQIVSQASGIKSQIQQYNVLLPKATRSIVGGGTYSYGAEGNVKYLTGKQGELLGYEDPMLQQSIVATPREKIEFAKSGQLSRLIFSEASIKGVGEGISTPRGEIKSGVYFSEPTYVSKEERGVVRATTSQSLFEKVISKIETSEAQKGGPQIISMFKQGGLKSRAKEIETYVEKKTQFLIEPAPGISSSFGLGPTIRHGALAITGAFTTPIKQPQTLPISYATGAAFGFVGQQISIIGPVAEKVVIGGGLVLTGAYGTSKYFQLKAEPSKAKRDIMLGGYVSTELIPAYFGGLFGQKISKQVTGMWRTRGAIGEISIESIATTKAIEGNVLRADVSRHVTLAKSQKYIPKEFEPLKTLPENKLYPHATSTEFSKPYEIKPGRSELPGLYVSTEGVALWATREGPKSYPRFSLLNFELGGGKPTIYYQEVNAFKKLPGKNLGEMQTFLGFEGKKAEGRFWDYTPIKGTRGAEPNIAYLPMIKGEPEAIIPTGTQEAFWTKYYTTYEGVRIPLWIQRPTEGGKLSSNAVLSTNLPASSQTNIDVFISKSNAKVTGVTSGSTFGRTSYMKKSRPISKISNISKISQPTSRVSRISRNSIISKPVSKTSKISKMSSLSAPSSRISKVSRPTTGISRTSKTSNLISRVSKPSKPSTTPKITRVQGMYWNWGKKQKPIISKGFYLKSKRKYRYTPSIIGTTMKPIRGKPMKAFSGLEVRRIYKR